MKTTLHRNIKGFTLIELIAVTAIIAIMLVFAVPMFQNPYAFDAERKALNQLTVKLESYKRRAVQEQTDYQMHFSFDRGVIWFSDSSKNIKSEEQQDVGQDRFALPGDLLLRDIEYIDRDKVSTGEAVILFSRKGYSDKVMIHLQNAQSDDISIIVEPFQLRVKVSRNYEEFDG